MPRTLGAQLIIVTALAVLVSNAGVAIWYAATRARETETALYERVLDRAVSVAALLSAIPAREREVVAHAMSSGPWRFHVVYGKATQKPMTDEEQRLADRARAILPPNRARQPMYVHFTNESEANEPNPPPAPAGLHSQRPVVEMSLPVVRNVQLRMLFFRPSIELWPDQIIVAALVAIIMTSVGAALIASRVARPMRELASAASLAARGGAAQHVSEQGPEDVSRAARAFNAMNDQVKRTLESQRQLLSAVGHDLRTPITAMRISAEFVADEEVRERIQKNLGRAPATHRSGARRCPRRRLGTDAQDRSCSAHRKSLYRSGRHGAAGDVANPFRRALFVPAKRNPPRGAKSHRERNRLWKAKRVSAWGNARRVCHHGR